MEKIKQTLDQIENSVDIFKYDMETNSFLIGREIVNHSLLFQEIDLITNVLNKNQLTYIIDEKLNIKLS